MDPMAQLEVESEIRRLSQELTKQTEQQAKYAEAAGRAQVDYKLAAARRLLELRGKGNGTVDEKNADVHVTCADQYEQMMLTEAVHKASIERGRNLRAQLDALRSINANVRAVVADHPGYGG